MPRKKYDSDFKTKVVLEILREEKSMAQLSSEYGVHVNQLRQWRDVARVFWPRAFEAEPPYLAQLRAYEQQMEQLYAEVGRLTTQLEWAKKIWPRSVASNGCPLLTGSHPRFRSRFRPTSWA
jgi:transposase-like protein